MSVDLRDRYEIPFQSYANRPYIPRFEWNSALTKFHWTYIYKALNGLAPPYLADLLIPYKPRKDLGSANIISNPHAYST